jgi:quercetin dioxygenase-like cupin family protein
MRDAVSAVDLATLAAAGDGPGALWRLDGEDLQANLIRLGLGDRIQPHRNDEVEVLMVVVAGRGELTTTCPLLLLALCDGATSG